MKALTIGWLTAALCLFPSVSQAGDRMRIETLADGAGVFNRLVARNMSTETLTITGGRFNGREDCVMVAATYSYAQRPQHAVMALNYGLEDEEGMRSRAWLFNAAPILAPFNLRSGEALELYLDASPCIKNGSDIVLIEINTTRGPITFSPGELLPPQ